MATRWPRWITRRWGAQSITGGGDRVGVDHQQFGGSADGQTVNGVVDDGGREVPAVHDRTAAARGDRHAVLDVGVATEVGDEGQLPRPPQ